MPKLRSDFWPALLERRSVRRRTGEVPRGFRGEERKPEHDSRMNAAMADANPTRIRSARRNAAGKEATGAVQSLNRGLLLLKRIAEAGRNGLTLTDAALQVGIAASTTHRLLNTLEQAGFVRRDPELGLWHIGLTAFSVGNGFLASRDVVARARPHMKRLMEQVGETVNLAVMHQGEAVYIAQVECMEVMRMIVELGSRVPIHGSAVGKAMMAWMSDAEVESALRYHGLAALTAHTITTMASLKANLAESRMRRYASDLEEHTIGLHCVATAVFNKDGEPIAALSVSGPKARMTLQRLPELGALVDRAAAEITREIGGTAPTSVEAPRRP